MRFGEVQVMRDEDAVSELIGAMLLLLIAVLYLDYLQAYEVPQATRELESQHFDRVYDDFLYFRSSIEDVVHHSTPKTATIHLGMRYPQRLLLQNPGIGMYGSLTSYPVHVNVSYINSTGVLRWENYTSHGFVYEATGVGDFPKLVLENGIVIKKIWECESY